MKLWRRRRGQEDDSCDALAPASLARSRKPDEESPIAAPLHQANVSGKDIPDAAAYLRNHPPPPDTHTTTKKIQNILTAVFLYIIVFP